MDLADSLSEGRLTSEEVVSHYLKQISRHNKRYHAFVSVYDEDAPSAARAYDLLQRAGQRLGRWHGLPIALKDLIDIEGRETTAGSLAWRERTPRRTATVARPLKQAGMFIIRKTHAVEFALGGWGTNERMGTPWNPWDLDRHRVPGGSSSGSAVAVAAGLVPWALGTDTGGSVRMPAGYCGLTGFKPTVGRISTYGVVPLSRTMDTIGPLTRTVEETAALYELLRGFVEIDPLTLSVRPDEVRTDLNRGLRGLRIATMPTGEREGVSKDVLAAYDRTIDELQAAGATVDPIELPCRFLDYFANNARIVSVEGFSQFRSYAEDDTLPLDPVVRARVLGGSAVLAGDFLQALRTREADIAAFNEAMAPFDALLTPTTETTAIPVDAIDPNNQPSRFTRVANYLNLCALSVPNGRDADGLPTSVQIICKAFADSTALRIGAAYQKATRWHLARPVAIE